MIRKMDYINKTMTEIVKQYIDNGYVFSKTMSGHQGEIYKLDLEKNGNVVRFIVNEGRTRKEAEKEYDFEKAEVIFILVEMFENANCNSILWNGKGKELLYIEYYKLNNHRNNNIIVFDDYNEYKLAYEKQYNRIENRYNTNNKIVNIPINSKIMDIVHNKNGCKSVRKSQIKEVYSYINKYSNKKYYTIRIAEKGSITITA